MRNPTVLLLASVVAVAGWIVLTFVLDLRSGWTHVALVIGVLLAVVGIVEGVDRQLPPSGDDVTER